MRHNHDIRRPGGFILAEALIALLVLGVVFLALEGASAMAIRSLTESERDSIAARLAEVRREQLLSGGCIGSAGTDSVNSVAVFWVATPSGRILRVTQESHRQRRGGDIVELYDATGACG